MLFLFVPQESWDLQLRMFGYITCGFPRIFGYVLQVIKYSISVPLDRGGFGGWNLMLTNLCLVQSAERPHRCPTLRMRSIDQTIDRQRFFLGSPTSRDRGKKEKGCARCVQILTLDN